MQTNSKAIRSPFDDRNLTVKVVGPLRRGISIAGEETGDEYPIPYSTDPKKTGKLLSAVWGFR